MLYFDCSKATGSLRGYNTAHSRSTLCPYRLLGICLGGEEGSISRNAEETDGANNKSSKSSQYMVGSKMENSKSEARILKQALFRKTKDDDNKGYIHLLH